MSCEAIGDEIRALDTTGLERLTAALTERFRQVLGSDAIVSFLTSHIVTAHISPNLIPEARSAILDCSRM